MIRKEKCCGQTPVQFWDNIELKMDEFLLSFFPKLCATTKF